MTNQLVSIRVPDSPMFVCSFTKVPVVIERRSGLSISMLVTTSSG